MPELPRGGRMNLGWRLWSLKIKSDHLKMPRPCAVEFHVGGYNNGGYLEDATGLSLRHLHKFFSFAAPPPDVRKVFDP